MDNIFSSRWFDRLEFSGSFSYIVPLKAVVYIFGNGNTLGVLYIYSVVDDQRHK